MSFRCPVISLPLCWQSTGRGGESGAIHIRLSKSDSSSCSIDISRVARCVVDVRVMRRIGDGRVRWLPQAGRRQLDEGDVVQGRGGVTGIAVVSRRARITIAAGIRIDPRMGHFQQKLVLVDVISDYLVVNFRCNSATAQDKRFSFVKISSTKWFSRARTKKPLSRSHRETLSSVSNWRAIQV